MDRNVIGDVMGKALAVALRKESVDRNLPGVIFVRPPAGPSLSARRAWIEMAGLYPLSVMLVESLSARRAWIEIIYH